MVKNQIRKKFPFEVWKGVNNGTCEVVLIHRDNKDPDYCYQMIPITHTNDEKYKLTQYVASLPRDQNLVVLPGSMNPITLFVDLRNTQDDDSSSSEPEKDSLYVQLANCLSS